MLLGSGLGTYLAQELGLWGWHWRCRDVQRREPLDLGSDAIVGEHLVVFFRGIEQPMCVLRGGWQAREQTVDRKQGRVVHIYTGPYLPEIGDGERGTLACGWWKKGPR